MRCRVISLTCLLTWEPLMTSWTSPPCTLLPERYTPAPPPPPPAPPPLPSPLSCCKAELNIRLQSRHSPQPHTPYPQLYACCCAWLHLGPQSARSPAADHQQAAKGGRGLCHNGTPDCSSFNTSSSACKQCMHSPSAYKLFFFRKLHHRYLFSGVSTVCEIVSEA